MSAFELAGGVVAPRVSFLFASPNVGPPPASAGTVELSPGAYRSAWRVESGLSPGPSTIERGRGGAVGSIAAGGRRRAARSRR